MRRMRYEALALHVVAFWGRALWTSVRSQSPESASPVVPRRNGHSPVTHKAAEPNGTATPTAAPTAAPTDEELDSDTVRRREEARAIVWPSVIVMWTGWFVVQVKKAMAHSWKGYVKCAWGMDDAQPLRSAANMRA